MPEPSEILGLDSGVTAVSYDTIVALAASALGDPSYATWSQAQLREWVLEAVRDFSRFFRRIKTTILTCAAGTRQYELPTDAWAAIRVEHPTGRTPPAYLSRFDHNRADFTDRDDRFDFWISGDQADAHLWISRTPALGEYIDVYYVAYWQTPNGASWNLHMAETHHPLLVYYVVWRAYHERWTHALLDNLTITYSEILDPTLPGVTNPAYEFATERAGQWHDAVVQARRTYEEAIERASLQTARGEWQRWEMTDVDVIY